MADEPNKQGSWWATLRIKLNNGVLLDEKFDPYWELSGHNELGEFNSRWPQVRSIEFVR